MTKAQQKEKAIQTMESRINSIKQSLDPATLEYNDDVFFGMMLLCYRLQIITKDEKIALESAEIDAYSDRKKELEATTAA